MRHSKRIENYIINYRNLNGCIYNVAVYPKDKKKIENVNSFSIIEEVEGKVI